MNPDVVSEMILELRTRWRAIILGLSIGAIVALLCSLFLWGYKAEATFAIGRSQSGSKAGQFAAQLGLIAGIGSSSDPVEFYARLVNSRTFQRAVVSGRLTLAEGSSVTYMEAFGIAGDQSSSSVLVEAADDLSDRLHATLDPLAGTVSLSVRARDAKLAEAVLGRVVEEVSEFNLQRRQYASRTERQFAEERQAALRRELDSAEDALARFLEANRQLDGAPQLAARQRRLADEVSRIRAVLTTVEQGYEQARIEEVRNTPSITNIDAPELSAERVLSPVPAILLGAAVGAVMAVLTLVAGRAWKMLGLENAGMTPVVKS